MVTTNRDKTRKKKTPVSLLSEIPGLTPRIVGLLEAGGIKNVETLLEFSQEELSKISGIGKTTAEQILRLLRESIEWVEEG